MDIDIDMELKLLSGLPIEIKNVGYIHSLTLKEIINIGYTLHNLYLSNLCFNKKDIYKESQENKELEKYTCFDIICANCITNEEYKNLITNGLGLFFNEKVDFVKEYGVFYLGQIENGRFITNENFETIKQILKWQNLIQEVKEEEYNPANEQARQLIEKIKKNRKNAPKIKENSTLQSVVSGVAWKSHIGIHSVWDLTIYQLYDAYYRLQIIDEFNNTFTGIYAGTVDAKKTNIKDLSWIKTTNKK